MLSKAYKRTTAYNPITISIITAFWRMCGVVVEVEYCRVKKSGVISSNFGEL